jgi:hypothetical protein
MSNFSSYLSYTRFLLASNRAAIVLLFAFSLTSTGLYAQAPKPEPDVVVFPNGEKLIGHFESFIGGAAKFKSDTLGEITIDLTKVQEMRTSEKFAGARSQLPTKRLRSMPATASQRRLLRSLI